MLRTKEEIIAKIEELRFSMPGILSYCGSFRKFGCIIAIYITMLSIPVFCVDNAVVIFIVFPAALILPFVIYGLILFKKAERKKCTLALANALEAILKIMENPEERQMLYDVLDKMIVARNADKKKIIKRFMSAEDSSIRRMQRAWVAALSWVASPGELSHGSS